MHAVEPTPHAVAGALALAAALLAGRPPPPRSGRSRARTGRRSIKLGFLAQPQAEWLDTADRRRDVQNLFLRRFRIIFSGRVAEKWSFFFETDSPNVGKANPDRAANPTGRRTRARSTSRTRS